MQREEIEAGARAIVDTVTMASAARGASHGDVVAMASIAFVEIIGQAAGPKGAAEFFRDLADQIEADHVKRIG